MYGFPMGMDRRLGTRSTPLKDYDARYEPLFHPGDQGSFTIFHDAVRAVGPDRSTSVDPMAGLPVERVVAVGGSQSAMRLVAYFNGLHATDPIVDGFVLGVWEGRAPRYEEGSMPFGTMTRVRDDIPTPMIVVNSEFEAGPLANTAVVDTATFRIWEVAGTPHAPSPISTDDGGWTSNPLVLAPLHEAAVRAIQCWLTEGTEPRAPAAHRGRAGPAGPHPARRARERVGRYPAARARGAVARVPGHRVRDGPPTAHGVVARLCARRRRPPLSVPRGVRIAVVCGGRRSRNERGVAPRRRRADEGARPAPASLESAATEQEGAAIGTRLWDVRRGQPSLRGSRCLHPVSPRNAASGLLLGDRRARSPFDRRREPRVGLHREPDVRSGGGGRRVGPAQGGTAGRPAGVPGSGPAGGSVRRAGHRGVVDVPDVGVGIERDRGRQLVVAVGSDVVVQPVVGGAVGVRVRGPHLRDAAVHLVGCRSVGGDVGVGARARMPGDHGLWRPGANAVGVVLAGGPDVRSVVGAVRRGRRRGVRACCGGGLQPAFGRVHGQLRTATVPGPTARRPARIAAARCRISSPR